MSKKFLDIRGVTYRPEGTGVMSSEYAQQHLPVREQTKAVGHAVCATYLYSGKCMDPSDFRPIISENRNRGQMKKYKRFAA